MKGTAGPQYLRAEDLIKDGKWCEFTLTIKEIIPAGTVKAADKSLIEHPIAVFEKTDKQWIVQKINERLMAYATGTNVPDEWAGKQVRLQACIGDWFGQKGVAAVRVALPPEVPKPFMKKKDYGQPLTGNQVGIEVK